MRGPEALRSARKHRRREEGGVEVEEFHTELLQHFRLKADRSFLGLDDLPDGSDTGESTRFVATWTGEGAVQESPGVSDTKKTTYASSQGIKKGGCLAMRERKGYAVRSFAIKGRYLFR